MPKSKTDFTNFVDARPNYFPGQFLLEDDFEIEQKYLIDRQKYHRQSLHVSGIVEGLEVEVIQNKQEVLIKSGSGINSNGDLIVLKKDTSFSQFTPLTVGELYISYKEEKQVKQQEDFTRWQEVPTIGFAVTTPNDGVKLAKISIVNNVPTLDLTIRSYSGIFLPNATGNDLTLRSGGNANPNLAILNGSLTVTGTITGKIDATNISSGTLAVDRIPNLPADKITSGTIGGKITVSGNQQILFTDTDITNNLKLQLWSGYGLGINASTLFYASGGKHSWRDNNGTNERMVLTTGADSSLTINTGGVDGWNKLVVNTTSNWGDGNNQYVTIGAGGANGIMLNGPQVSWQSDQKRASIRYGKSGGVTSGSYWDVGVRESGAFSFAVNGNTDHKLSISSNGNVGIGTITPSEKLEVSGNLKVTGNITTELWQTPSLQNGWVIYSETTGNPPRPVYNPPGYFKDSFGIVHLRGLVQNGGGTIFTLPVGYRPAYREVQAVQTYNNTIGRLDVLTDGQVMMYQGNNVWFSLDGVTFRAAL